MLLKEYPEIILDVIPRLYEIHTKVFITNLYGMEKQMMPLPNKFCKMYTTQPLALQILRYLTLRKVQISMLDFHIVEESQPFTIRLKDGKRLEMMLCAGNELGSTLMILIRKLTGGRLLYCYSAAQQDDLCRLMGNVTFQEWIAHGTEILYLNLQSAYEPSVQVDFVEIAENILKYSEQIEKEVVIEVPGFGYESLIRRLAQTSTLFGHIIMLESYLNNYCCLTTDMKHFSRPGYKNIVIVKHLGSDDYDCERPYPLADLKWSPVPSRINLIQICSLLRPLKIHGIVGHHDNGNVPLVPEYLKKFKLKYSPKASEAPSSEQVPSGASPTKSHKDGPSSRRDNIIFSKQKKLAFVDSDDDKE